jgi:hypothetical protein
MKILKFCTKWTYFMKFFPKYLWRIHVNIRTCTQNVKAAFFLNGNSPNCWDFYFILLKFKSILIDVKKNLTNVNQVLNDFKVIYDSLTKYYIRFQVNIENFNKFSRIPR